MPNRPLGQALRFACGLTSQALAGDTDEQLLRRFFSRRDETAFELLLQRHGPMVLGVCRRLLVGEHDAEDAFQATFVVLLRRAGSIRKASSLASWLHGVARRVSLKAQVMAARRSARERTVPSPSVVHPDDLENREACVALEEELEVLPERYRAPVVLCCLEGRTKAEAARHLGLSEGTVSSRLARARQRLRERLALRGWALSAAVACLLEGRNTPAAVPPTLLAAVERLAALTAEGAAVETGGGAVMALAQAVLKTAALTRRLVNLFLVTAGVGMGLAAIQLVTASPPPPPPRVAKPSADAERAVSGLKDRYGDPLPLGARARLGTVRLRHGGPVSGVAFAPDGKTLASSGSDDRLLRLWKADTGEELRQFSGHSHYVECVAFSPDGKTLASGGHFDRSVRLWDAASGQELATLQGHGGEVWAVAFSPGGETLASASQDGTVRLWDVPARRERLQLDGHNDAVKAAAFSSDGKTVISAGRDGTIRFWNEASGAEVRRLPGHRDGTTCLALSPDGRILASGGADRAVRLWDPTSGKELHRLDGHREHVSCLAFAPDGKTLASGSWDETIRLWDVPTGKPAGVLKGHTHIVRGVDFAPDGKTMASAGFDGTVRLWDVAARKEIRPPEGHQGSVKSTAFAPDGKTLATGGFDNVVRLWDAVQGVELRQFRGHREVVADLSYSSDARILVSASYDGTIRLWDPATGREKLQLKAHKDWASCVCLLRDGKRVASGGFDGEVVVWDATTGAEQRRFSGLGRVHGLALSSDGRWLAAGVGGPDVEQGEVYLWDLKEGNLQRRLSEAGGIVRSVAFSPDGRTLASGSYDGVVRLWDPETGRVFREFTAHNGYIESVKFSPTGRSLVTGGYDRSVCVWETATGQLRTRFQGHKGGVYAVAFSPDGETVASTSWDGTALLWQVLVRQSVWAGDQRTEQAVQRLWSDLTKGEAGVAYKALGSLTAFPAQALPAVRKHLRPVAVLDAKLREQARRWLTELDGDRFELREKAAKGLEELGEAAEPLLRKALTDSPSPEARRRVEELLGRLQANGQTPSAARLLQVRALELLEAIGTSEARLLLKELRGGAPGAWLTGEAEAALRRLEK